MRHHALLVFRAITLASAANLWAADGQLPSRSGRPPRQVDLQDTQRLPTWTAGVERSRPRSTRVPTDSSHTRETSGSGRWRPRAFMGSPRRSIWAFSMGNRTESSCRMAAIGPLQSGGLRVSAEMVGDGSGMLSYALPLSATKMLLATSRLMLCCWLATFRVSGPSKGSICSTVTSVFRPMPRPVR